MRIFVLFATLIVCARPLVIAHRGASGHLPEHTLASYILSYDSADYIELDLVSTKDNQLISLHDITLEKTTNVEAIYPQRRKGRHWYAKDFTLKELKRLKTHERTLNGRPVFPKRFPENVTLFPIPTLKEVIALINGLNKGQSAKRGLYIELKKPKYHLENGIDLIPLLLRQLKSFKGPVFIQCFDSDTLKELKSKYKVKYPLIQLISQSQFNKMGSSAGILKIKSYAQGIGPWYPLILKGNLIQLAHKNNLQVHVYTARKDQFSNQFLSYKEFIRHLSTLGIDGIFTDFPKITRKYL